MIDRLEIDANELTFTARAAGPEDGRPVFLLHGFPQTSWSWRFHLSALGEAGYWAMAPDQRGYSPGARPRSVAAYAMVNLVEDVLSMADAMGIDTFDLVGHDWGGMVAWMLATHFPDRVRSLTVASTPHPLALHHSLVSGDEEQQQRSLSMDAFRQPKAPEKVLMGADKSGSGLRSLLTGSGLDDDYTSAYVEVLSQPGALTAALNWYRAMDVEDLLHLSPVTVPTLYVWSSGDAALSRAAAEATGECVRAPYRFEVLEGVGHWIPEMAPWEFSRMLLSHLATH